MRTCAHACMHSVRPCVHAIAQPQRRAAGRCGDQHIKSRVPHPRHEPPGGAAGSVAACARVRARAPIYMHACTNVCARIWRQDRAETGMASPPSLDLLPEAAVGNPPDVRTRARARAHVCVRVRGRVCIRTCICACVRACVRLCMRVGIGACTRPCAGASVRPCIHTRVRRSVRSRTRREPLKSGMRAFVCVCVRSAVRPCDCVSAHPSVRV